MSLKCIEELREKATKERIFLMSKDDALKMADEIEAELEERFIELPLDANGVPINIGDNLCSDEYGGKSFPCRGFCVDVRNGGKYWSVCMDYDSYSGTSEYTSARRCRHIRGRTIADVLFKLVDDCHSITFDYMDGVNKAAAEIRELMRDENGMQTD